MTAVQAGGRVLELTNRRQFTLTTLPAPSVAPGDAVVRVAATGLCGTDLHAFDGREGSYPVVLGHDCAGVVESVGPGADRSLVGARVTIDPTVACGQCAACRRGRRNLCASGRYLGMTTAGTLAELVRVPAAQLVHLPDTVSDRAATVLEPIAVALHLLERVAGVLSEPGPAVVVGGGPLGICTALVLAARGWAVAVHEPIAARRDLAAALGLQARSVTEGAEAAGGGDPVLVVETSAAAAGTALAERLATPGSVIGLIGRSPADVSTRAVLLRELAVLGVKGGAGHYPAAVRLVADGTLPVERLITHHFPFRQAQAAFETATRHRAEVVRAVLEGGW